MAFLLPSEECRLAKSAGARLLARDVLHRHEIAPSLRIQRSGFRGRQVSKEVGLTTLRAH